MIVLHVTLCGEISERQKIIGRVNYTARLSFGFITRLSYCAMQINALSI